MVSGQQKIELVEPNNKEPKWKTVRKFVLSQLISGKYGPGDLIPTETSLAKEAGIARNTVRQALINLEKEGYLSRIQGKGTFVAERKTAASGEPKGAVLEPYALVVPEFSRSLYPRMLKGFEAGASLTHHQVISCNTDINIHKQADIIMQLIDRNVSGVAIVTPPRPTTPKHQISLLQRNNIPVVLCHRNVEGVSAPVLTWDRKQVGSNAAKSFIENGHKKIGYIGLLRYSITEDHVAGMKEQAQKYGIEIEQENIFFGPAQSLMANNEALETMVDKLLSRTHRPTGIFCSDDGVAEFVYWIAMKNGIDVPSELSILGFGDNERDSMVRERLTSITINEYELGKKATRLLNEMAKGVRPITDNEVFMQDLNVSQGHTLGKCVKC